MKILLYGLNFSPELTGIGKYTGEMAAWLARSGHDVHVVTTPPYYPAWRIGIGYKSSQWKYEKWLGVQVWRCPLWVPTAPSGIKRLLHLASFAISSMPILLRQVFWRPDLVWTVEPALFCAPGALLTAKLSGARAWLHIQDFEVDAAFDLGLLRGKKIREVVERVESWIMRRFDVVSTISGRMMERLHSKGVALEKSIPSPNWVDISSITPYAMVAPNLYRSKLNISSQSIVALYSGNMGNKQGLEILAKVAELCALKEFSQHLNIVFIFCGNGAARDGLQLQCKELTNVHFLELQPIEKLNDLLSAADIHLLPQRGDAADLVMPSKLTGMLASGKPIIATAHPKTELSNVIIGTSEEECCGLVTPPENPLLFAQAICRLASDALTRTNMGRAARRYAERNLDIDTILTRMNNKIESLFAPSSEVNK